MIISQDLMIFIGSLPILSFYFYILYQSKNVIFELLKIIIFLVSLYLFIPFTVTFYFWFMRSSSGEFIYFPDDALNLWMNSFFTAFYYVLFIMPWILMHRARNNVKLLILLSRVTVAVVAFFIPFISKITAYQAINIVSQADIDEGIVPQKPKYLEIAWQAQGRYHKGRFYADDRKRKDAIGLSPCNDWCQRLLLSGEVEKIAMTRLQEPHSRKSVVYHLEKRSPCDINFDGNVRSSNINGDDRNYVSSDVKKAIAQSGLCIIPTVEGTIPDVVRLSGAVVDWNEFYQSRLKKSFFSIISYSILSLSSSFYSDKDYNDTNIMSINIDRISGNNNHVLFSKSLLSTGYFTAPLTLDIFKYIGSLGMKNKPDRLFFNNSIITPYIGNETFKFYNRSVEDYGYNIPWALRHILHYSLYTKDELVLRAETLAKTYPD